MKEIDTSQLSQEEKRLMKKLRPYLLLWYGYDREKTPNPFDCTDPSLAFLLPLWNKWSENPEDFYADRRFPKAKRIPFYQHLKECNRCQVELRPKGRTMFLTFFARQEFSPEEYQTFLRMRRHFRSILLERLPRIPYITKTTEWKKTMESFLRHARPQQKT